MCQTKYITLIPAVCLFLDYLHYFSISCYAIVLISAVVIQSCGNCYFNSMTQNRGPHTLSDFCRISSFDFSRTVDEFTVADAAVMKLSPSTTINNLINQLTAVEYSSNFGLQDTSRSPAFNKRMISRASVTSNVAEARGKTLAKRGYGRLTDLRKVPGRPRPPTSARRNTDTSRSNTTARLPLSILRSSLWPETQLDVVQLPHVSIGRNSPQPPAYCSCGCCEWRRSSRRSSCNWQNSSHGATSSRRRPSTDPLHRLSRMLLRRWLRYLDTRERKHEKISQDRRCLSKYVCGKLSVTVFTDLTATSAD